MAAIMAKIAFKIQLFKTIAKDKQTMIETLIKSDYWDNFNMELYLRVLRAKINQNK